MKSVQEVEAMVLAMPNSVKDYPFGEDVAVYFIDLRPKTLDLSKSQKPQEPPLRSPISDLRSSRKMFALISETSTPVRLSLKCDPQLAELLREKYESVLPGYHLNKKHWNTIICSGQVGDDELRDLIRHSYELASSSS